MDFLTIGVSTVRDGAAGRYTEDEVVEVLRVYRALGVRAVEFSHVFGMTAESAKRIGERCRGWGMVPWSAHMRGISADVERSRATLEYDLSMAEKLGATVAVLHGMGVKPDGSHYIERYREAADMAASHGLLLAFETGTCPGYTDKADHEVLIELADGVDRPNVGINIDTGHSALRDTASVQEVVRKVGGRLITLHCQDNFGLRDDHQAPGVGKIDWTEVLRALKESPYNGPFMMELTDCAKDKRALYQNDGYMMTIEQEIAGASSWLSYLWSRLD